MLNIAKYLYALFVCSLMGASLCISAQETETAADNGPQTLAELQGAVEKIRQEHGVPALGIALVNREEIEWTAGLGLASLEQKTPADEHTLFRIGSISKMFVGIAVLQLVEQGRLNINVRLSDLAPEIAFNNPWEETHPVRLVHLLEHTSGWPDLSLAEFAYQAPDTMTLKEALDYRPETRTSRWVPGTRTAYCNIGPAIAAYIIEKITGQTFEDYVQQHIFDPLQMTSSTFFASARYQQKGATLYVNNRPQDYWQIIMRPAGAINSSAQDMAQFLLMLLQDGSYNQQKIISESSLKRMEIHKSTLGSSLGLTAGYGIYNYTSGHGGFQVAFHGHNGGMEGAQAELAYAPQLGAGYVFMINTTNPAAMNKISQVMRAYLLRNSQQPEGEPRPLPDAFKQAEGFYMAINYRNDISRFFSDMLSFIRVETSDQFFHRSPVLGGWRSNDFVFNDQLLVDAWSGLPSIALVNDPLAGPVLQVGSDFFKPVSALRVYSVLGLNTAFSLISFLSLLCLAFWGMRRMIKRIPLDNSVWIRFWPLVATGVLILALLFMSSGNLFMLGRVSFVSVSIMLVTLTYACTCGICLWTLWRYRRVSKWIYAYACIYTGLHLFMLGQLASYGLIGLRTWA